MTESVVFDGPTCIPLEICRFQKNPDNVDPDIHVGPSKTTLLVIYDMKPPT